MFDVEITAVAWSNNGEYFVASNTFGEAAVYRTFGSFHIFGISYTSGYISAVTVSNYGSIVVVAIRDSGGSTSSTLDVHQIDGSFSTYPVTGQVLGLALSDDDKYVAALIEDMDNQNDRSIKLFKRDTWDEVSSQDFDQSEKVLTMFIVDGGGVKVVLDGLEKTVVFSELEPQDVEFDATIKNNTNEVIVVVQQGSPDVTLQPGESQVITVAGPLEVQDEQGQTIISQVAATSEVAVTSEQLFVSVHPDITGGVQAGVGATEDDTGVEIREFTNTLSHPVQVQVGDVSWTLQPGENVRTAFSGASNDTPVVITGGADPNSPVTASVKLEDIQSDSSQEVGRSTFGSEKTLQVVNNTGGVQYVTDSLGERHRIAPGEAKEVTVLKGSVQVVDESDNPVGDPLNTTSASVVTLHADLSNGGVHVSSGEAQPENKRTKMLQNPSKRVVQFVAASLRKIIPSRSFEVIEYVADKEKLKSYQIIQK